jgi:hypothetical protein
MLDAARGNVRSHYFGYCERQEDKAMSYVVRVTHSEKGDRYTACEALADATALFDLADAVVPDERDAAYLYEVAGQDDPSAAVEAVQAGKGVILRRDTYHEWVNLSPEEQLRRAEL